MLTTDSYRNSEIVSLLARSYEVLAFKLEGFSDVSDTDGPIHQYHCNFNYSARFIYFIMHSTGQI